MGGHRIGARRSCYLRPQARRWDGHQRATRSLSGLVVLPHNIYDPTSKWKRPEALKNVFIHFFLFFELNEFLARGERLGQDFLNQQYHER